MLKDIFKIIVFNLSYELKKNNIKFKEFNELSSVNISLVHRNYTKFIQKPFMKHVLFDRMFHFHFILFRILKIYYCKMEYVTQKEKKNFLNKQATKKISFTKNIFIIYLTKNIFI